MAAGTDLYALNASTRRVAPSYPMTTYAGMQPIRNAEANNLALQLLGLGPIPGSSFNYAQDLKVTLPLTITGISNQGDGNFTISGTADKSGKVVLLKTTSLTLAWTPIQTNDVTAGVPFGFLVSQGTDPQALFRLMGQ